MKSKKVVIIGAGPAGLTAAYELDKGGVESVVLEKDSVVGGIARTVQRNGYHFDIGGHRFFTKVSAVEDMWKEVLGDNLIRRERLSRIYYNKKFFYYPLRPANALFQLGIWRSILLVLSYMRVQIFPIKNETSFEDWVSNRFGRRLYETFFKTYTEKVWGIPCTQLSAEWAAQRIKGLSLMTALKNALLKAPAGGDQVVTTLVDSFYYPKLGPGMMWETVADVVTAGRSELRLDSDVQKIVWSGDAIQAVDVSVNGTTERVEGTDFVSSMPVRELVQKLDPPPDADVLAAAADLSYRDFLTVALVVNKPEVFPDNWIYIHDPEVHVGRLQNFKNWSPDMVPDPKKSCIGLEYFCFEGNELWSTPDAELVELGKREMERLGLVQGSDVEEGMVVRMPKAYPVYDGKHTDALSKIRRFLDGIGNLQLVGRNGMHKYNNQDHSMLTAMLAAKNVMGANLDIWTVNVDQEYHEEIKPEELEKRETYAALEATQPRVPMPMEEAEGFQEVAVRAFARLDKPAFATAIGTVAGVYLMLATLWLVIKGGDVVGPNLSLLGQYFIGFTVSYKGAFVGLLYGFFWGFALGWLVAYLRNAVLSFYLFMIKRRAEANALKNFLDYI